MGTRAMAELDGLMAMETVRPLARAPHPNSIASTAPDNAPRAQIRAAAERFEAVFLTEMLSHSGLGQMREHFNGGVGERGFSGFLVREYAERIAATGTTGIADRIFEALIGAAEE